MLCESLCEGMLDVVAVACSCAEIATLFECHTLGTAAATFHPSCELINTQLCSNAVTVELVHSFVHESLA